MKRKKGKRVYIKIWILFSILILITAWHFSYSLNNSITAGLSHIEVQNSVPSINTEASIPFKLTLVNTDNPVSPSYYPENLINIFKKYGSSDVPLKDRFVMMNEEAYLACREMFIASSTTGIQGVYILSAYRNYSKQEELFNGYVARGGLADQYPLVSRPGQSEHHTGLAIDLAILQEYKPATNEFETSWQGKWFMENCWDYGFVLRYPENKKDITGIAYESWHFRYVGKEHSVKMKNMNLCLEEYLHSLYN